MLTYVLITLLSIDRQRLTANCQQTPPPSPPPIFADNKSLRSFRTFKLWYLPSISTKKIQLHFHCFVSGLCITFNRLHKINFLSVNELQAQTHTKRINNPTSPCVTKWSCAVNNNIYLLLLLAVLLQSLY